MGVQWEIGDNSFRFDFRIMELGPYDMVLGTDWMRSIGPCSKYQIQFQREGKEVHL